MLRKGRIDGAIAAYAEVLEERPDDWPAANRLGDLYMQAGKTKEAVDQFLLVAQQLCDRDLLPKAAALFKKVMKVVPEHEHALMQLAEIAERQGFLVDAKTHLTAYAEHRRRGGDDQEAAEVERRIAGLSTVKRDTAVTTVPALPANLRKQPDKDDDEWEINKQLLFERGPANGSPDPTADRPPTQRGRWRNKRRQPR
jgi:thioredoxin-like negative regulator of GroEL